MAITDAAATTDPSTLGFDIEALREKYTQERDKRLRPEGNNQYQEFKGGLERYAEDPYITEKIVREPVSETLDVLVIGGGFGGMFASVRLKDAGFEDIRIVEKAGDFGGTWYWNRYPGAQCDIESYIYLPFLEETGYIPKEKYSYQPEILEHAQRIGRHFGLYDRTYFQTQIKELRWQEKDARWVVTTDRGDTFNARYVVMSSGPLNRPKLPGIAGIDTYKGHIFHTSRWDYDYTGGNSSGGLDKLKDKRVAIIGTGATAIQSVPYVARYAEKLLVFQRTPSSVGLRLNAPTDPEWAKTLKPGWQKARDHNFTALVSGTPQEEDLVKDSWTDLFTTLAGIAPGTGAGDGEDPGLAAEIADFQKMNRIRERVDQSVKDKDTAESLKPWYRAWCKRPTFNDEFLPCFNQPNVELVDTDGHGVERITEKGLVVNGQEYEVDCIIFATGFEVGTAYTRRAAFEVYGRNGQTLTDYWAHGMKTFHGFLAHGFPNCFHMGLTQTGMSPNFTYMLDGQSEHIAKLLTEARARQAKTIEPTAEAEAEWVKVIRAPNPFKDLIATCTPGYYNAEGKATDETPGVFDNVYSAGPIHFYQMLDAWLNEGSYKGLEIK